MNSKQDYHKEYYLRNQEVIKQRSREWFADNAVAASKTRADYYQRNRTAIIARTKQYAATHQEQRKIVVRRWHLKTFYHWTVEGFDKMLADQGGRCAICRCDKPGGRGWHIDHDHQCCPGRESCGTCIRGILCQRCNAAIGLVDDDQAILKDAIVYLDRTKIRNPI